MFNANDFASSRISHGEFEDFSDTTKKTGKEARERVYSIYFGQMKGKMIMTGER